MFNFQFSTFEFIDQSFMFIGLIALYFALTLYFHLKSFDLFLPLLLVE